MAGERTSGGRGTRQASWAVEEPTRRMGHRQNGGGGRSRRRALMVASEQWPTVTAASSSPTQDPVR
jgi:hypothetical protein